MSGCNARRTKSPTFILEKAVLTEMLQLYQVFPCLWDQKHVSYGSKEAREQAYEALLEKYRLIQPDAVVFDVKKKIEYMRCAYRREHKRVLVAYHKGRTHRPMLWYYDLLTFLNDHHRDIKIVKTENLEETHEIDDSDEDSPPLKRIKEENQSNDNNIFLSEQHNDFLESDDNPQNYLEQDQTEGYIVPNNEAEAFGRTIGLQLKELNHMQRVYAEKLISDVIFQARLCKLNAETSLNLISVSAND